MTTLYRLTDAARKVLRRMADADTIEQAGAGYRAADGLVVDLPDSWVEEAPPPLPAEPEPGAYLLGDVIAVREAGPERGGSWCVLAATEARYQNLIGVPRRSDWAGVWGGFGAPDLPIVSLMPEVKPPSIDDPVSLPLDLPGEVSVSVNAANDYPNPPAETVAALRLVDPVQRGPVSLAFLDGDEARAAARALWKLAGGAS